MPKKKRGPIFIVIGIILVLAVVFGALSYRSYQKKKFDNLFNKKNILKVEYGIIPQEDKFIEQNSLFKKIEQDNEYYLCITEDNILYTYYLDWYYSFDPLKGYNLVYEIKLDKDTVEEIIKRIKSEERNDLYATIKEEYVTLHHNDNITYIKKYVLQDILQDNNIILNI